MSTTATPGTFQVSTDQVDLSNALEPSKVIRLNEDAGEQLRFDGSGGGSQPHFRAIQLNEFTNWLEGHHRIAPSQQPAFVTENTSGSDVGEHVRRLRSQPSIPEPSIVQRGGQNRVEGISIEKIFRVDAPVADTLNKHLPRPNFDTAYYVEPQRPNTRLAQPLIPTDGFDPAPRIDETIQRLKADGRVIGDLDQPESCDSGLRVPAFNWPLVTSSLLGSPAILNLELNVQNMLTATRNRVLVTSSQRGDGTTTVAIALARQLANHGQQVLLIDADLGNPTLAYRLGLVRQKSWIQAISDGCSAADLIVTQNTTPISLLPLSPAATRVGWPRKIYDLFGVMAEQISTRFDVVIIDVGPIHQLLAESTSPGIPAAATLLVSGCQRSSETHMQRAQAGLLSFGIDDLLIVQNFSRVRASGQAKVG